MADSFMSFNDLSSIWEKILSAGCLICVQQSFCVPIAWDSDPNLTPDTNDSTIYFEMYFIVEQMFMIASKIRLQHLAFNGATIYCIQPKKL